jgi:hypothetical protein
MRWWVLLLPAVALAATPEFRVESLPVAGGAELLTVFGRVPDAKPGFSPELPLLSVLRDTLGDDDPANDRLRYVWVLTSARPTLLQRAAGALPFFYWRADFIKDADRRPAPVLDLGATSRNVFDSLAGSLTQVLAFDPTGAWIRSSTRSYRNNLADHRRVHLLEGLAVLSRLEDLPEVKTILSEPELLEMETRLTLAGKTLGGLVSADHLPAAYIKERTRSEEMRGHNWELLRQHAEANGLYFEPFGINGSSTHALLWIAREDIPQDDARARKFDGQFLGISDPYRDTRLRNWTGYHQIRDGKDMIPLALYALEYPKVPLLLVDFRDSHSTKRREMIRHAATDTVSGVLGISKFGNWPFLVGSFGFNFVTVRHGATNDRAARLKAYSEVREWLALDGNIDPELREEMQKSLEIMGVNPMDASIADEAVIARKQYAALVRYAEDPHGLPERVAHDRETELTADHHKMPARVGFHLATIATLGMYNHREKYQDTLIAQLDLERRYASQMRFLEDVARSSPQTDIVWNMDDVRKAIDEVTATGAPARSAHLVEKIMRQTNDEETRALCQRALQNLDAASAMQ